jgi:hypothetical protein
MTRFMILLLLALVVVFPFQSLAQGVSDSKLSAITELLKVSGIDAVMDVQINHLTNTLMPLVFKGLSPNISEDNSKKLAQFFKERFKSDKGDYYWRAAAVYDKYFTHNEILEMLAWYKTPLGKKTITVMPELTKELIQVGERWGEEVGRRAFFEINEKAKKFKK